MKISVKVKPGSKRNIVDYTGENQYTIHVKEKAIEGRANEALIGLISEFFDIPRNKVRVLRGLKSRNKVIEIKKEG